MKDLTKNELRDIKDKKLYQVKGVRKNKMTEEKTLLSFMDASAQFPSQEYEGVENGDIFDVKKLSETKVEAKLVEFDGKQKRRFFFEYDKKKYAVGITIIGIIAKAIKEKYTSVQILKDGQGKNAKYSAVYER